MNIDKKWLIWGGVGTLVLVGGYYYLSASSQPVDQTTASGATTLPDLTYATAPLGATDLGGASGASSLGGSDALTSLINAFAGNQQPTQAALDTQAAEQTQSSAVSVFSSLLTYLNAHKGLNKIQAIVPTVGTVQIGPTPTKIINNTKPPATLSFKKGTQTLTSASTNATRITNLLKRGFKPV